MLDVGWARTSGMRRRCRCSCAGCGVSLTLLTLPTRAPVCCGACPGMMGAARRLMRWEPMPADSAAEQGDEAEPHHPVLHMQSALPSVPPCTYGLCALL